MPATLSTETVVSSVLAGRATSCPPRTLGRFPTRATAVRLRITEPPPDPDGVEPPNGRNYDSLWEIAERHLGDGRRYKEIYELNKDRVQPDGQKLTDASLIRPGWILEMPADATGGDLITEMPASARVKLPA